MNYLNYYGNVIHFGRIVLKVNFMKKIYINEDKLSLLINEEKEVTFYEFFVSAKKFLKDLLDKPHEAEPSELFKKNGISKSDLISKMKDIGMLKSNERIDEVPVEEGKTHPYGTKLVAKHYVKYLVPRKRFEDKMKALYKELFAECGDRKQVFKDTEQLITDILDMDSDGAYKNRGGYDKDVVEEDGAANGGGATSCGNVMQGGGHNPDARTIYHSYVTSTT